MKRKAPTNLLQPARFWTSLPSSVRFFKHLHLFFNSPSSGAHCLPLFTFPGGVHLRVACGSLFLSIRRTWPSHRHLLCFISSTTMTLIVFKLVVINGGNKWQIGCNKTSHCVKHTNDLTSKLCTYSVFVCQM